MESQRLITVSLGKIAQSRCQRGGINLHKNLLVATVLHKARTAYMMESYSYQQSLQRQKVQQMYTCAPSQTIELPVDESNKGEAQPSCDSDLGHPYATPTVDEENMLEVPTSAPCELVSQDPVQSLEIEAEILYNKENSPPVNADLPVFPENVTLSSVTDSTEHLSAANHLSQEAQLTSPSDRTTCKVLKRRCNKRVANSSEYECPVSKKARVSYDLSLPPTSCIDYSDLSSDDTDVDDISDSPQISNLVNIFNSGFSGLCAVTNDSSINSSGYESDLDISKSQSQFTPSNKLRSESQTTPYSRIMSDPSLLCSTQVNRLESMPSAILLSA